MICFMRVSCTRTRTVKSQTSKKLKFTYIISIAGNGTWTSALQRKAGW